MGGDCEAVDDAGAAVVADKYDADVRGTVGCEERFDYCGAVGEFIVAC